MTIGETIRHIYENTILVYAVTWFVFSFLLVVLSAMAVRAFKRRMGLAHYENMLGSPLTPGISVLVPAYNKGAALITCVRALLTLNYPQFEVIVVNDGGTDDSLDSLIEAFALIPVDYVYPLHIPSLPVNGLYLSKDAAFARLRVVDKERGNHADARNVGLNVASYDYYLCADPEGSFDKDILLKLIKAVIAEPQKRVIAVTTTSRVSNSCVIENGVVLRMRTPRQWLVRFQELAAIRGGFLGKAGLSGGPCLLNKAVVAAIGGYVPVALFPDMDLLDRLRRFAAEQRGPFVVSHVPNTVSWRRAPDSVQSLMEEKSRRAIGMVQGLVGQRRLLFNPSYGTTGMIRLPYLFFFMILAPVVELSVFLYYAVALFKGTVDPVHVLLVLIFIYVYGVMVSFLSIFWDQWAFRPYGSLAEVGGLCAAACIEGFWYHPLHIAAFLRGYLRFLRGKKREVPYNS